MKTKAEVRTSKYFFSHGKQPKGRGLWMFENGVGTTICFHGTYTQAKKEAQKVMSGVIQVCP